jgi:hypothetical protein
VVERRKASCSRWSSGRARKARQHRECVCRRSASLFSFPFLPVPSFVIAGLDPAIHAAKTLITTDRFVVPQLSVDHRVEPGGDEACVSLFDSVHD